MGLRVRFCAEQRVKGLAAAVAVLSLASCTSVVSVADAEMRPLGPAEHLSPEVHANYRVSLDISRDSLRTIVNGEVYMRADIINCESHKYITNSEPFLKNIRMASFDGIRSELVKDTSTRFTLVGDIPDTPYHLIESACVTLSGSSYLLHRIRSNTVRIKHVQL
jgi:hypothetical protein